MSPKRNTISELEGIWPLEWEAGEGEYIASWRGCKLRLYEVNGLWFADNHALSMSGDPARASITPQRVLVKLMCTIEANAKRMTEAVDSFGPDY